VGAERSPPQVKPLQIEHAEPCTQFSLSGEVWVRENDFLPVRVTLVSGSQDLVRQEASVEYAMSSFGALLPFFTEHHELRGTTVVAENKFSYTDFHKFAASSDIKFETQ